MHSTKKVTVLCAGMFAAMMSISVQPKPAEAALFLTADALAQSQVFALDPVFDPVGLLVGTDANGNNFAAGSGVLIDPYWVLTAGHVPLAPIGTSGTPWASMRFSLSPDVVANQHTLLPVADWHIFPGYDRTFAAGKGDDIALVRLVDPIFDVAPAVRFYGEDQVNTEFNMAGYGYPGVWPNLDPWDGIRRAGQNIGVSFGTAGLTNAEEQFWMVTLNSVNSLPLEWQGTNVDSGAPWFALIENEWKLKAISSFGIGNTTTGAIRVSLYNDWIDSTMALVPEPSSAMLLGMGLVGLLARHRMRRVQVRSYGKAGSYLGQMPRVAVASRDKETSHESIKFTTPNHSRTRLLLCLLALFGMMVPKPAHADLIHNGADPTVYLAHAANFSEWVQPMGRYDNGIFDIGGSLTFIDPGGVRDGWRYPAVGLMSAHQALRVNNNPSSLYDGYAVSFTRNFFTDPQPWIDAFDVAINPLYTGNRSAGDLALLFFDAEFDFRPLSLYTGPHSVGDRYHSAGFGIFGTPATGLEGFTGDLWAGTNRLSATNAFGSFLRFRFASPGQSTFEPLGSLVTPGSSGGGLFPEDWETSLMLAGNASLWGGAPGYGVSGFYTPFTQEAANWVNQEILLRRTVVPEPSSGLLLAGAVSALLFVRRIRFSN